MERATQVGRPASPSRSVGRPSSEFPGEHLHHGTADSWEIRTYDSAGKLIRIARAPGERERVTRAEIEAFVKRMTSLGGAFAETRARLYDELPFPQTKPAYYDLIADREGNLWVMGQGPERTVFDARGILLGTVRIPTRMTIREIGSDYVLATTRDELGVERVELFDLVKPGR